MRFAILELAKVGVTIRISLEAFAITEVMLPESLILSTISILHDTLAMSLAIDDGAQIDSILVANLLEAIYLLDCREIDFVGFKLDVLG